MKKSLSALLAATLVFSSFASIASAADAELTAQQKFEALKEKGIFAGINGEAALDQKMNRAQFARVAALILGLEGIGNPDTKVVTEKPFSDVALNAWYTEEIAAAKEAKLLEGNGDGTFKPSADISVQELAIVTAKLLNLTPVADATVDGAAAWAAGSIQALKDAGVDFPTNYKEAATREQLVNLSFVANEKINGAIGAAESFTVAATGAKKLTVTFDGAVDTAKAKITVWNGSNQVNSKSVTFADDKKSAVVEFANNLAAAEYTVKVEGLSETAQEVKVKVDAEKATKIEITSDKAALTRGNSMEISVGYNVLNQYGEKINNESISATASKGTAVAASGTATITAGSNFALDEKVALSLVHSNGTFATANLTVSTVAQVASVDIVSLHDNGSDKKDLQVGGTVGNYYLVVDLKDQYGNSVADNVYLDNGTDVIVSVSNTAAVSVNGYNGTNNTATFSTLNIDGTNKLVLQLAGGLTAGTSTVTIISKTTGAKDSFDVVVKEAVKVDTITLSAPSVAVAGETITIPFTAVDQFGKAIDNPINGQVTSRDASGTANDPYFEKDHVKNVTNLKLNLGDVAGKGTVIVTIITGTNKVQQLTINVVDPAVPTVITGTKDFETAVLKDGTVTIGTGNLKVQDQYGRDITVDWDDAVATTNKYRAFIESGSSNVTLSDDNIDTGAGVTLTGANKGSSSITLKLQKYSGTAWVDVANSSYSYNQKVVGKDEITSYAVTVDGKVLQTTATGYTVNHDKELKVKGSLADGSTVTVTNNVYNYEIDTTSLPTGVTYNAGTGKIQVGAGYTGVAAADKTEATFNVVVIVKGANGQEVKTVEVTASDADSAPATLAVNPVANGKAAKEGDNVISVLEADINAGLAAVINDAVETKDQYGVVIADNYTNYESNFSNSARQTVATVDAGDTFNVTVVSGGKTLTLKVIVK